MGEKRLQIFQTLGTYFRNFETSNRFSDFAGVIRDLAHIIKVPS